jgi:type 1 glutamine amidotransferase
MVDLARAIGCVALLGVACADAPAQEDLQPRLGDAALAGGDLHVLAFSRTAGYRHASIDVAVPALQQLGAERGWTVDATEDPAVFTAETLAAYDVVVFLLTSDDVLDDTQQEAFESFIALGRGYVGVHSASDTEYDWPWYGEMLGGYFTDHPAPQDATIHVVDGEHASTDHLRDSWVRFDEWYNFAPNPSATVDVLLRLDETTYSGGTMGDDHPIAWTREHGGGRAFYTGGGHTSESWAEPAFLTHVAGGIAWAGTKRDDPGTSSGSESGGGSSGPAGSTATTTTTGAGDTGASTSGGSDVGSSSATTSPGGSASGSDDDAGSTSSGAGCGCRSSGPASPVWLLPIVAAFRRRVSRSGRRPG